MQGMIRRRFAAFSPWPGRRKGRRRSPCRKAGWITQPAALPQSRCCLCLLRPIPRKKTALRRCMAAQGVTKQEGILQPAARPSGRTGGSAPKAYGRLKKWRCFAHNTLFDGAAAARPCFASRSVISVAGACRTAAFSFSSLQKSRNRLFCAPARNTRRAHRRTARPWQGAGGRSRQ